MGEVHALLGENGAGKSTLVRILAGVAQPDEGELAVDGQPVRFSGPRDAQAKGVAIVSQELSLFPDLDVLGNLFVKWLTAEPSLVLLDDPTRGVDVMVPGPQ